MGGRSDRLTDQVGNNLAHRDVTLTGQVFSHLHEIVVDIESCSHTSSLHQASTNRMTDASRQCYEQAGAAAQGPDFQIRPDPLAQSAQVGMLFFRAGTRTRKIGRRGALDPACGAGSRFAAIGFC